MIKNVRVQHSVPSLAQVVQDVEPGFGKNPDPHVTLVLTPSLFAHVLDVRMQHSLPSLVHALQDVEPRFGENPGPHVTLVLSPSLFAHVLPAQHACAYKHIALATKQPACCLYCQHGA